MRGKDGRWLYTAPCGIRAKWPSEWRTPVYILRMDFNLNAFSVLALEKQMEKSIVPKSTLVVGIPIRRKRNVFNDSYVMNHIIWPISYWSYNMGIRMSHWNHQLVPFKYWIRANSSWWWFDSRLRLFWWWQKPSHKLSTKTIL